jgi:two-component system cell cycle response regulator DivK
LLNHTTVLVADDNYDIRSLFEFQLSTLGFKVFMACDGAEAIEIAKRERPILVLMDINMPNVDGIEATIELRKDRALEGMRIVAVSAYNTDAIREEALQAGCDQWFQKIDAIETLPKIIVAETLAFD